jgi:hypothetical protein
MGLAAPLFLAGLGLLALPLWLHLLKRHRSTPQHFSSLMFFERSTSASVRQRQLDYILLLLLRLALLALAIFAFARPFISRALLPAERSGLTIVAIDASASMGAENKLSRARTGAVQVIDSLPAGAKARVLSFGSTSQLLTGAIDARDELKAAIGSVKPTASRSSLGDLAASLRNLGRTAGEPVTVHLFSDLQRSSMPPAFDELRLDAGMKLVVHRIEGREKANWTVESVNAPARLLDPATARVEAVVAGFNTPAASKTVLLRVNGREIARRTAQVSASGKARVVFDGGLDVPYGFAQCEVAIAETDALEADNAFLFAVNRADPDHIHFSGNGSANDGYLFVQTAIESVAPNLLNLKRSVPGEPPGSATAMILSDPGAMTAASEEAFRSYLRAGGAALITVGPATAAAGKIPGVGLAVEGSKYAERGSERFQQVSEADQTHPVMEGAGRWENVRFYQSFQVNPGQSKVIARLSDSTPILIETRLGEGKALILTSPLDSRANDLPLQPVFLQFIEKSLRWLSDAGERVGSVNVDASYELRQSATAAAVEVLTPSGQRALSVSEAAQARAISLDQKGFWTVRRAGGRTEMVAANIDRRESDLEEMPAESAELWQGETATNASAPSAAQDATQRQLWPWLLGLALAAALAEVWVASKHLNREQRA